MLMRVRGRGRAQRHGGVGAQPLGRRRLPARRRHVVVLLVLLLCARGGAIPGRRRDEGRRRRREHREGMPRQARGRLGRRRARRSQSQGGGMTSRRRPRAHLHLLLLLLFVTWPLAARGGAGILLAQLLLDSPHVVDRTAEAVVPALIFEHFVQHLDAADQVLLTAEAGVRPAGRFAVGEEILQEQLGLFGRILQRGAHSGHVECLLPGEGDGINKVDVVGKRPLWIPSSPRWKAIDNLVQLRHDLTRAPRCRDG